MESDRPEQYLLDPLAYLAIPMLSLATEEQSRLLMNGMKIEPPAATGKLKNNGLYITTFEGDPVAVVRHEAKKLKPVKVFHLNPAPAKT